MFPNLDKSVTENSTEAEVIVSNKSYEYFVFY
jgi:hypothetical protein